MHPNDTPSGELWLLDQSIERDETFVDGKYDVDDRPTARYKIVITIRGNCWNDWIVNKKYCFFVCELLDLYIFFSSSPWSRYMFYTHWWIQIYWSIDVQLMCNAFWSFHILVKCITVKPTFFPLDSITFLVSNESIEPSPIIILYKNKTENRKRERKWISKLTIFHKL